MARYFLETRIPSPSSPASTKRREETSKRVLSLGRRMQQPPVLGCGAVPWPLASLFHTKQARAGLSLSFSNASTVHPFLLPKHKCTIALTLAKQEHKPPVQAPAPVPSACEPLAANSSAIACPCQKRHPPYLAIFFPRTSMSTRINGNQHRDERSRCTAAGYHCTVAPQNRSPLIRAGQACGSAHSRPFLSDRACMQKRDWGLDSESFRLSHTCTTFASAAGRPVARAGVK